MYIKDIALALALPVLALSAAIPQDPPPFVEDPSSDDADIVGGVAASSGDFPFIVSLQTSSGSHFCGGSLLNANTVLTAAHCTVGQSAGSLRVRAGTLNRASGGTLVSVSSLKVHPNYRSSSQDYDVAIWKLATSIPTSSTISYARLAASGSDPAAGSTNTVAGWGVTTENGSSPTALRKVDVPVVSRASCQSSYGTSAVTTNMYCAGLTAGGKDSCQGDSGGPIVDTSARTLLGVVSWGDGCARPNAPGVYARVGATSLNSFITSNL
ncbi:trypsin [Paraphoma chrysanthemicola]|nr:trypsin [Paraphoma chrysanthemicola]